MNLWERNVVKDFKILSSTNDSNIILVAPHGRTTAPFDDIRTAKIASLIQEKLDCYAVINQKYRKPRENEPLYAPGRKICNLNRIDRYEGTPLYDSFIGSIKKFKKQISDSGNIPYIFHLHGAKDNAIKAVCRREGVENGDKISVLIGTGRGNPHESLSASADKVSSLIDSLKQEQIFAHSTADSKFAAKKSYNLNQLFKQRYTDDTVNSFQLEIKYTGYRDSGSNASKTANRIASAIMNMLGEVVVVEPELIESNDLPVQKKDQLDIAVEKIIDIYQKAANDAMLGVGKYLINTFFQGNYARA